MKLKSFLSKSKTKITCALAMATMAVATVIPSFAADTDYSEQIKTEFTSAADNIIPIIIGVMGAGLAIFGIFQGIKLAKKMFGSVSNG